MTRHYVSGLLLALLLLLATGCEQISIAQQEQIRSLETLQASTPSTTPTPSITPTPIPTVTPTPSPTLTPTRGPSPTPTPTPVPSPTPLPPTATPNPALANFSLCNQSVGDLSGGRFSAQIATITTTVEPSLERLTLGLTVPADSAPPHATARCIAAADAGQAGGYLLLIDLEGWLHDDAFRASTISPTQTFSGTTILTQLAYRFDPNAEAGAALAIALDQPLPFRITLAKDPYRLVLEVARTSPPANDPLSAPGAAARPESPIYYLQDGDVWRFADGKSANLTNSPEAETGLAVSQAAGRIAFCRAAPGAGVDDARASSALWMMGLDGSDLRQFAAPGRTCADPAFSLDGASVAFAVDETGAVPPRLSIWVTPLTGDAAPRRLTPPNDEWSRFGPRWLADGGLVYAALAEDGRSTLFVHTSAGVEQDIGADLVKGDRYRMLGRPVVSLDGGTIAVEALRANKEGADLVLLDASGAELSNHNPIGDGYWTRPLAWNAAGTLFYLTIPCPGEVAHEYVLHARGKTGDDQVIASGSTLGGIGHFTVVGKGLAFVTLAHAPGGPRGPLAIDSASASALWFWDPSGDGRARLVEAPSPITDLAP